MSKKPNEPVPDNLPLSRRAMLSGIASAPLAATAFPKSNRPLAWQRVVADYRAACRRHEIFLDQMLGPATRAYTVARSRTKFDEVLRLEQQGDELYGWRLEAFKAVMAQPAPDFEALHLKVRLAFEEVLRFSAENEFIQEILRDFVSVRRSQKN